MKDSLNRAAISLLVLVIVVLECIGGYLATKDTMLMNFLGSLAMAGGVLGVWCMDRWDPMSAAAKPYGNALYFGAIAGLVGFLAAYCFWVPAGVTISGWAQLAMYGALALNIFSFRFVSTGWPSVFVFGGVTVLFVATPMVFTLALAVN